MAKLGNIKDWAAGIFVRAEQRGVFDKLPAFQRDLSQYPQLAVLAQNVESLNERILKLLAWLGHGNGPWSGFPSEEAAPVHLLGGFSAKELAGAMQSRELSRQELEGAARFVAWWFPPQQREAHQKFIAEIAGSLLWQALETHVKASGDGDKIARFKKAAVMRAS